MSAVAARTIGDANTLTRDEFVALLGGVYEHSPWVAEHTWEHRPFASIAAMAEAMQQAVMAASAERQLELIRAHPELLGKLAAAELTAASRTEQAAAGLDRCTAEQRAQMQELNLAYRERFGFPFVVAVRGLNWGDIIVRVAGRLAHRREQEVATALEEIGRIARLRLDGLLKE
jgi:2-oxo-4-hydroxy-4-carboxy-5-ureidoimidazoline decarboxylase